MYDEVPLGEASACGSVAKRSFGPNRPTSILPSVSSLVSIESKKLGRDETCAANILFLCSFTPTGR